MRGCWARPRVGKGELVSFGDSKDIVKNQPSRSERVGLKHDSVCPLEVPCGFLGTRAGGWRAGEGSYVAHKSEQQRQHGGERVQQQHARAARPPRQHAGRSQAAQHARGLVQQRLSQRLPDAGLPTAFRITRDHSSLPCSCVCCCGRCVGVVSGREGSPWRRRAVRQAACEVPSDTAQSFGSMRESSSQQNPGREYATTPSGLGFTLKASSKEALCGLEWIHNRTPHAYPAAVAPIISVSRPATCADG